MPEMENIINILTLTHNYPRTLQDHSGRFILNIYKHLPESFKVKIIAPQTVFTTFVPDRDIYEGIEVVRVKYWFKNSQNLFYGGVIKKMSNPVNIIKLISFCIAVYLSSISEIKSAVKAGRKYNIIHAHWWIPNGLIAWMLSQVSKTPYIVTSHGTDIFILRKYKSLRFLAKKVLEKAKLITVVSSSIAQALADVFGDDYIKQNFKVEIIPMPYESNKFDHTISDKQENIILSIGRFTERKGYRYLIEGFAEFLKYCSSHDIDPPVLKLYGFGPELAALKKLAKSLNVESSIFFMGEIKDHTEVPDIFKTARAFVISSITDRNKESEGLGIVILEAIASGIPLIATESGGITDLVKHKINGYLVPEKDSHALAKALAFFFENPGKVNQYASRALEDVLQYSDKNISKRFQQCLTRIAS